MAEFEPRSFPLAQNRRQMARAAGLHPDHWYPVAYESDVRRGQLLETRFWGRSIVVFRRKDSHLAALENRCAHRHVKLSLGEVTDCTLTCPYHGWSYAADGRLAAIPHELFGRTLPNVRVASFPVCSRYGLIWIFPGDPARAATTAIPEIPELEGADPWPCVPVDFTWRAHHSMIIENVSDFTHAHLHRRYRPFSDARLVHHETIGSEVVLRYDVLVGDGRISRHFVDRKRVNVNSMTLGFRYPYQWSNTGDRIKHWCFLLPMDAHTTRAFFLFYFDALRIPFTRVKVPRQLMYPLLQLANRLMIRPLLAQDGTMVEAEQRAYEAAPAAPAIELNPVVLEFQKVIVKEWQRHLKAAEPASALGRNVA